MGVTSLIGSRSGLEPAIVPFELPLWPLVIDAGCPDSDSAPHSRTPSPHCFL